MSGSVGAAQITPLRLRRLAEIAGQLVVDEELDAAGTLRVVIDAVLDELCTHEPRAFACVVADVVCERLHSDGAA